jgi:hypothetical protein
MEKYNVYNQEVLVMNLRDTNNNNDILLPAAASAIEQMKYEIAREFGVTLGPDATARANGSVGGEITKRLVRMAEEQLSGQYKTH